MPNWLYYTLSLGSLGLLLVLELRSREFRDACFRDRQRAARNWSYLVGSLLTMTVLKQFTERFPTLITPAFDWREHLAWELLACFVLAEGLGWVLHYIKHTNAFLWKFHFQHHRDEHYSIWLTAHTHAFEVMVSSALVSAVLAWCGFSVFATQVYVLFYAAANTYQHSSFDYSLGWLDTLIVNPAYHRHHHAVGSRTNYGNTLTLWDLIFRAVLWPTSRFKPEVEIGLGESAPEPRGFWSELLYFLRPRRS